MVYRTPAVKAISGLASLCIQMMCAASYFLHTFFVVLVEQWIVLTPLGDMSK